MQALLVGGGVGEREGLRERDGWEEANNACMDSCGSARPGEGDRGRRPGDFGRECLRCEVTRGSSGLSHAGKRFSAAVSHAETRTTRCHCVTRVPWPHPWFHTARANKLQPSRLVVNSTRVIHPQGVACIGCGVRHCWMWVTDAEFRTHHLDSRQSSHYRRIRHYQRIDCPDTRTTREYIIVHMFLRIQT